MTFKDALILFGKDEKLLKTLKNILTEFDVYIVTDENNLMNIYETILPEFVVITSDKKMREVDIFSLIEHMKEINKDVQIIVSKEPKDVKDIKLKTLNILKDIEQEVERVSTKFVQNKLYRLELEVASLREQQVMLTAEIEQLRIAAEDSSKRMKATINKAVKTGLLSYNAVSILMIILSAIKSNSSTFINFALSNPIIFSIVAFGVFFTIVLGIPMIAKKILHRNDKDYLYDFKGINKEVNKEFKKRRKNRFI